MKYLLLLGLTFTLGACSTASTYQPGYVETDPQLKDNIAQVKNQYADNNEVLVSALNALAPKDGEADALLLALEKQEASLGSISAPVVAKAVLQESSFATYQLRNTWRYRVVLANLLSNTPYNTYSVTSDDIRYIESQCAPKKPEQFKGSLKPYERLLAQACFSYAVGDSVLLAEKKALLATFLTSPMPTTTQKRIVAFLKTNSGPHDYLTNILGNI